jgi:hypothetical protein
MKIFYPILIVTAGISIASASEVPKEGTYEYSACWSGTVVEMPLNGGAVAQNTEITGTTRAKTPGTMFDNNSFRCLGSQIMHDGKVASGRAVCMALDADGDKRYASFTTGEDGKTVRKELGGTGKYDGMVTSNQTVEMMPTTPIVVPGTVQGCNHQTGTYKLK